MRLPSPRAGEGGVFRLSGILKLRFIIVFPFDNAILLFDPGDIKVADFQASMLQHIRLDFLIGSLALRRSQIQIVQIQLYLDMVLVLSLAKRTTVSTCHEPLGLMCARTANLLALGKIANCKSLPVI